MSRLTLVLVLVSMMMVTTTAVADYNLTGLWHADDGGLYYIRHVGDQIWWAGLSTNSTAGYLDFFKGLDFANVFRGTLSGTRISGTWADVPRGAILSHGTLALDILPDYPSGLALRKVSATGGFGANVWHNYVIATPATECSARPGVRCAFDHVHKNDGSTLYDNLKPEKDYVAIFGWVAEGLGLSYPATAGRTYDDFIAVGDHDDGDGDLVFNLYVDWANLNAQPGFWTTNWEYPDGPSVVMSKLRANQYKLHGETIMYGRSDGHHPPLLPGWMESNANSPLWNGRPINGLVLAGPPTSVDGAVLTRGKRIRVTGVLALDCGHFPYDCENDDMAEIHPVYSIDVVQDWTQRGPTANLTGVWAGGDGGTYYIRQIGNTVWWIGISRDQGRTFTNVFQGTIGTEYIQGEGWHQVINGQWVDVPLGSTVGSGTLKLLGKYCLTRCDVTAPIALYNHLSVWAVTGGFGGQTWEKLYDRGPISFPPPSSVGPDPMR